uniref:Uncharacterized protein n=1 Tax=Steinernema glaseri TaxID=37863 RepID=A0A1I7XZV2_9BILA
MSHIRVQQDGLSTHSHRPTPNVENRFRADSLARVVLRACSMPSTRFALGRLAVARLTINPSPVMDEFHFPPRALPADCASRSPPEASPERRPPDSSRSSVDTSPSFGGKPPQGRGVARGTVAGRTKRPGGFVTLGAAACSVNSRAPLARHSPTGPGPESEGRKAVPQRRAPGF